MSARPRLAVVAWLARDPNTPRGNRAQAVVERLRRDWEVELVAPEQSGSGGDPPTDLAYRVKRAAGHGLLLDKHEPQARRRLGSWTPRAQGALLVGAPFSPVAVAALRLRRARIPYVVDVGDPWVLTADGPLPRTPATWRKRRAERELWAGAAAAVVTTELQAERLRATFPGLQVLARANGYDPIVLPERSAQPSAGILRLAHFGHLYEPRLDLVDFLARLRDSREWDEIHLDLYGSDWSGQLDHRADRVRVTTKSPRPWAEVVELAGRYDAALALGNRSPVQLPSKAIQYLTLPIPRIAVTSGHRDDALARYVEGKPGWLAVAHADPESGRKIAEHLAQPRDRASLEPPEQEAWPAVATEIADFVRHVLPHPRAAEPASPAIA